MSRQEFFASAARNLGSLLADELRALGLPEASETRGGARFAGTLEDGWRACLWSRVASRILLPLATFPAGTPDDLHAGALDVPWEEHLAPDRTFAIRFDGQLDVAGDTRFAVLRVKDAIVDRLTARRGRRPAVDPDTPDLPLHVHVHQGVATLSLDLSGGSLHRRGYRAEGAAAPLKETLAAALLLRAGWPALAAEGASLLDPMCGSGTLIIEGALMAADSAPGLARPRFGFEGWTRHDPVAWARLRAEAAERRALGLERLRGRRGALRGHDRDPAAIRAARANLERAGLTGLAHFECRALDDCRPARPGETGLLIVNPPYGERLGADSDLPALHAQLGAVLRERFTGWRAALFTGQPELGHALGLRAQRMHSMYNGPIACRLLHFQVEPGSCPDRPRPAPAPRSAGATMFANRLVKNLKTLARWRRDQDIDCYRLYDADLPEYAVAIDVYQGDRGDGGWAQVQEYAPPATVDPERARQRLREALAVVPEILDLPPAHVFLKIRQPQKGHQQYQRLAASGRFHAVREGGYRFLVNFEDYLDTGLFLDHRDTRRMIGELAAGARFLNLFGYTGTATVHAAGGGARATTTVDLSHTYLDWAARNLALNGLAGPEHRLIQADCREWLERQRGRQRFDLIFLDPPSFSNSRRMRGTLDIQRDQTDLILAAADLLEPEGQLIFSNNLRRFRLDAEALSDLCIEDLGARTRPRDFARNPRIHHCWSLRWRAPLQPAPTARWSDR